MDFLCINGGALPFGFLGSQDKPYQNKKNFDLVDPGKTDCSWVQGLCMNHLAFGPPKAERVGQPKSLLKSPKISLTS